MPHQSNNALQSQGFAPKYAFARSESKYEPGKEANHRDRRALSPDAWDKAGEYREYNDNAALRQTSNQADET